MNIINERIQLLRDLMKEKCVDYYIIPTGDPHGSEYIDAYFRQREFMSGFTGSAGTMLVTKEKSILFVDGRYHIQADEQCSDTEIEIYKLGLNGVPNCTKYLSENVKPGETVGFYGDYLDEKTFEGINKTLTNNEDSKDIGFSIEDDLVDIIWSGQDNSLGQADSIASRPKRTANPVFALPEEITGTKAEDKLENLRRFIEEKNLDGILVSELSDICWLLNVRGSDIEYNPVMMAYLLVMKESCTVFLQEGAIKGSLHKTDNAGTTTNGLHNTSIDVNTNITSYLTSINVQIAPYDDIRMELAKLKNKRIGLDLNSTSCLNYKILDCGNYITPINNYEAIPKHIKDEKEIELSRKYHKLDAMAMRQFIKWVKAAVKAENLPEFLKDDEVWNQIHPGEEYPEYITEYDAAMYLDYLRSQIPGFVSLSFETISAYAENGAIVHYSPDKENSKRLMPKGLLLVDSGAQYMGATTDITRTISLGPLTQEEITAYTLVLKGNFKLMNAVFPDGTRGENLDILAREALWQRGLDYLHGTGHGIGAFLNVHEGPCSIRFRINNDAPQPPLKPGVILSDEPGYYEAGKFGIRHETQVVVVENKALSDSKYGKFYCFEPLSLVPFEMESVDITLLTKEEISILDSYHKLCDEAVR